MKARRTVPFSPGSLPFDMRGAIFGAALVSSSIALTHCAGETPPAATAPAASPSSSVAPAPAVTASVAAEPIDAGPPPASAPSTPTEPPHLASRSVAVPGVTAPLSFDYLAADRERGRVYLAVGNTGSLDVFDVAGGAFTRVDGFKTAEREVRGKKRMMGPSAATVGDGVVYVGDRATNEVCAVDAKALKLGKCVKLPTPTDGVAYVASTKEIWVTTPGDQSLTVLDASHADAPKPKTVIKLGGDVEGFAIDEAHGLFFTNTEDKGTTLAVDLKTHKLRSTWSPGCGADGPRGVAVDTRRSLLFVACTDHVQVLDEAHDGAPLGKLDTGAGVDNLDYVEASGLLFVGAGKAARLTVARFDDKGNPSVVATGETAQGARNAVADGSGSAYVPDPANASLLILGPLPK